MTPALFDLPLRLGDAVSFAAVVFEFEGKTLTEEIRARIGVRASSLRSEAMVPYPGSIERDPIHPAAYYCCVDGIGGQPLLLRMAPASAPSSGLFPNAILIGRTQVASREMVINAVPFGPGDNDRIRTFSEDLNTAFQPRPFGTRPVIRVRGDAPSAQFPFAAEALRSILKTTGQNPACFAALPGTNYARFYFETVWALIRAGWREGYAMQADVNTGEHVRQAALYTRFGIRSASLIPAIRESRRQGFDVELIVPPGELEASLEDLKSRGFSAQSVRLEPDVAIPADAEAIASRFRAQLNQREVSLAGLVAHKSILHAFAAI